MPREAKGAPHQPQSSTTAPTPRVRSLLGAWDGDSCGVPATAATDHGVGGVSWPCWGVCVRSLHEWGDWHLVSTSGLGTQAVDRGRSPSRKLGAHLLVAASGVGLPDLARSAGGAGTTARGLSDVVKGKDG